MRIAYLSDTHLAAPDPESLSLFPRQIRRSSDPRRLYLLVRDAVERCYQSVIGWLGAHGPCRTQRPLQNSQNLSNLKPAVHPLGLFRVQANERVQAAVPQGQTGPPAATEDGHDHEGQDLRDPGRVPRLLW
ncbi:MAG: hypothetical protein UY92_C0013G0022 [Candidatus Magasanikbacteria bacterium GW2011_GWA2_56_11]|uniref:Uncharacterized protein n=1 Tax=Candidatus Magasanikbacteria bacterium GW2011_GWA2_56_11 TaxID=1619044 RepID=A0A0G1YEB3_9BACT|nr:MAG: hypothetical protein UY92_C0013G0022 [Candidatus Magasanikbacteria bacterium GW2011_GWA2_56_11]